MMRPWSSSRGAIQVPRLQLQLYCMSFPAVRKSPGRRRRLSSMEALSPPRPVKADVTEEKDELCMYGSNIQVCVKCMYFDFVCICYAAKRWFMWHDLSAYSCYSEHKQPVLIKCGYFNPEAIVCIELVYLHIHGQLFTE